MDRYSAAEEAQRQSLLELLDDVVKNEDNINYDNNKNDNLIAKKLDYSRQIERWNKYQNVLDKIEDKCKQTKGDVRLNRNIKHNVKILDDVSVAFLLVIGLTALMIIVGGLMERGNNKYYSIIGGTIALAFVGWQIILRVFRPSIVRFTCRPVLHMEEYAYMNNHIQGIPKVARDPLVKLPSLEMQIPRSWLAQQGMLEFMESLKDIKFDKEE